MTASSRYRFFSDAQWELISGRLPSNQGRCGHHFGDDRRVVDGIVFRKRHRRYAADGTWDRVLIAMLQTADAQGQLDWTVSVDATIDRAHQHATNTTRPDQDTGGWVELPETATA